MGLSRISTDRGHGEMAQFLGGGGVHESEQADSGLMRVHVRPGDPATEQLPLLDDGQRRAAEAGGLADGAARDGHAADTTSQSGGHDLTDP